MPLFVAEGVVVVDSAMELDIREMKAKLAEAGKRFRATAGAERQTEWRTELEFPTATEGLDRSKAKESEDNPSSRLRKVHRGWRYDQV